MTATKEQRDATEQYINDLERRLAEVEDAARAVCRFGLTADDMAEVVGRLREVLGPEQPIDENPNP